VPAQNDVCRDERDDLRHDHSRRKCCEGLMEGVREEQVCKIADGKQQRTDVGNEGAQEDIGGSGKFEPLNQSQHHGRKHYRRCIQREDRRNDCASDECITVERVRVSPGNQRASNGGPVEEAALADQQRKCE
jgi:hypothetical protein